MDDVDDESLAAKKAEMDRLLPVIRRQDAVVSLAANAPRIAGQLRSAAAAGNWWAVAGWTLRAVEVVLLEVGHLRHDAAQHQAALEYWGRAQRAALAAVPDDDQLTERSKVLGQWARHAPGRAARRGTMVGTAVYVLGRGVLRVQRRRASPTMRSAWPAPSRSRRALFAGLAGIDDLIRFVVPTVPDHRGD